MVSLFVVGLLFSFALNGKTGWAQSLNTAPLPKVKPVEDMSPSIAEAFLNNIGVKPDLPPVPSSKPMQDRSDEQGYMVLASLTPPSKPIASKSDVTAGSDTQSLKFFGKKDNAVFTDKQRAIYKEIFDLQKADKFSEADKKIKKLTNDILVGHVLAERYLESDKYISSYKELTTWLKRYSDHPQAKRVYALMLRKKPDSAQVAIDKPKVKSLLSGSLGTSSNQHKSYKSTKNRNTVQQDAVRSLSYKINSHVRNYEPTQALLLLGADKSALYLDDVEYDEYRAQIAAGYLYAGKYKEAMALSRDAWKRSGQYVPLSGWIYGLTLWKDKKYKKAAESFETVASSPYSSGWMVSAASYWTARSFKKTRKKSEAKKYLELSAYYNHTFYGVIAAYELDKKASYNWELPSFNKDAKRLITKTNSGHRAIALLEIGLNDLAERELLVFNKGISRAYKKALIALASEYKLPALQMRLGSLYAQGDGDLYDGALYPWAPWQPEGGYRVDKALVHAFVRQESRFNANAENPSGATGLMQLMPRTASYIAGHKRYETNSGRENLKQPTVNLSLGQDYIAHLLQHKVVQGDLLSLAVAYNAGPGKLSRWKKERSDIDDPLLFIETIPVAETRAFVERVLANYWIYKTKAGERSPSLKAVSKGEWALYAGEILPRTTTVASR